LPAAGSWVSRNKGRFPAAGKQWHTALVAVGLLLAGLGGCGEKGPPLGRVSGTIALGGRPLADAAVEFQPEQGGAPSHGTTDAQGRYELIYLPGQPGALLGSHRVSISTYRRLSNADGTTTVVPEGVPPQYNEDSTLVREVKPGRNTIDFEL